MYRVFTGLIFFPVFGMFFYVYRHRECHAIAANAPYAFSTLLIPLLNFFVLFAAVDAFDRDAKLHVVRMLHVRPVSTIEYVLGKALGILLVVLGTLYAFLFVFAIAEGVFSQVPVSPAGYLIPFVMAAPAFVTLVGITFLGLTIIRNRAVTLLVLGAAYWAVTFVYCSVADNLLDYSMLRVPLYYSGFIGFSNKWTLFEHRGMWLFTGLAGLMLAAARFNRVCKRSDTVISLMAALLLLAGAVILGLGYRADFRYGQNMRDRMRTLDRNAAKNPRVTVTDCNIDFHHVKDLMEAGASLRFVNNTGASIDRYLFNLNPGLDVISVTRGNAAISFTRDLHLLSVTPDNPLVPGMADSLTVRYRGCIDQDACYADIGESIRKRPRKQNDLALPLYFGGIGTRYVLLTPECLWYPTAGVPFGSAFPAITARDFVRFSLHVATSQELLPVSQGTGIQESDGVWTFTTECALPQISLVIGDYEKRSLTVDDVEYALYTGKGHDYFTGCFPDIEDKMPRFILEYRDYYEDYVGRDYPFRRFALVEVPLPFTVFSRFWCAGTEAVQPETVFLSERGIRERFSDFQHPGRHVFGVKRMSPEEIQSKQLDKFIYSSILNLGFNDSKNIFPNFYRFVNSIQSEDTPLLNSMIEWWLYSKVPLSGYLWGYEFKPGRYEKAGRALTGRKPADILSDPENSDAGVVLKGLSHGLFTRLETTLGGNAFESFLVTYLDRSRGYSVPAESLFAAFRERFSTELGPDIDRCLNNSDLPGCIVTGAKYYPLTGSAGMLYQIRFTAFNPGESDGVFIARAHYRKTDINFDRDQRDDWVSHVFILPAQSAREIGFVSEQPIQKSLVIDTFLSRNLPEIYSVQLTEINPDEGTLPFMGEREMVEPPSLTAPGEILVDNEDFGFQILPDPDRRILEQLLPRNGEITGLYVNRRVMNVAGLKIGVPVLPWYQKPPSLWRPVATPYSWGDVRKTAHVIKSGKGKQAVRWTADIPEQGLYEICFFVPEYYSAVRPWRGGSIVRDLHFGIETINETVQCDIDVSQTKSEWITLGTYTLPKGPSNVTLTNRTTGNAAYADAVKWLKR